MRLGKAPAATDEAPVWPPLLATRGPGGSSALHEHHALHLIVPYTGSIRVRGADAARWQSAAGVLTAPDVPHAIDARGVEVLLVFFDPESELGLCLAPTLGGAFRLVDERERTLLLKDAEPSALMQDGGVRWTERAGALLGAASRRQPRLIHPRVRRLLKLLRGLPPDADASLEALSAMVKLSPSRLMHVFSESIGMPLRPYLAWLKLQRAAGAIASGKKLTEAAALAGFADAAHMSRTFRKMFGVPPSALRPR
jgi:AraC-like DNA-binding protein